MHGCKILVVDDDFESLGVAQAILTSRGYIVYPAQNFKEVYHLVEEKNLQADLVILDLLLPIFSGFEIAKYLRKRPHYQKVPIIVMTARLHKDDEEKTLQAGCNYFLRKPYSVDGLLTPVSRLCQQNCCLL